MFSIRLTAALRPFWCVALLCASAAVTAGCSAGVTSRGTTPANLSSSSSASSPRPTTGDTGRSTPGGVGVSTISIPSITIPGLPGGSSSSVRAGTGSSKGSLPAGFPLPPGATVQNVVKDGAEIAATVVVPDAVQAFAFWKTALPAAGYSVRSTDSSGGLYEIRFGGHGFDGDTQIAITGAQVAIQLNRA